MSIEGLDFQPFIHQQVSLLIEGWKAVGFTDEEVSETANQVYNLGLICANQLVQEGALQAEGSNQQIPYTQELAESVVRLFLLGIDAAVYKGYEQRLPSNEKWQIIQNVAFHVFNQAKNLAVATLGQENTPNVQISDEQIKSYLNQTAVEALLYFVNEYEQQNGPITRTDVQEMPSIDDLQAAEAQPAETDEESFQPEPEIESTPVEPQPVAPEPQPVAASVAEAPARQTFPEHYHKLAAVGLYLSTLGASKQAAFLVSFTEEEQAIINQYRDPVAVARDLELGKVARYLRSFKDKLGQTRNAGKSRYTDHLASVIRQLPSKRLNQLFEKERPIVRGFVGQWTEVDKPQGQLYQLPPGVEEGLMYYLQRNFPHEEVLLKR